MEYLYKGVNVIMPFSKPKTQMQIINTFVQKGWSSIPRFTFWFVLERHRGALQRQCLLNPQCKQGQISRTRAPQGFDLKTRLDQITNDYSRLWNLKCARSKEPHPPSHLHSPSKELFTKELYRSNLTLWILFWLERTITPKTHYFGFWFGPQGVSTRGAPGTLTRGALDPTNSAISVLQLKYL